MKKFTNALMLGAISIATLVGISSCNKTANMTIDPAKATLHSGDTVLLSVVGAPAEVSLKVEILFLNISGIKKCPDSYRLSGLYFYILVALLYSSSRTRIFSVGSMMPPIEMSWLR